MTISVSGETLDCPLEVTKKQETPFKVQGVLLTGKYPAAELYRARSGF